MIRNIAIYVKDVLTNMRNAEQFVEGMTFEQFSADKKTSYAVARCIEIIGEAVKNVPAAVRRKHPGIPWKEIAGMRDKLIHFYFGVDAQKVWLVVKERIPQMKPLFEKVLGDIEGREKDRIL
jgi:uncharacterized protein with HEPN domain